MFERLLWQDVGLFAPGKEYMFVVLLLSSIFDSLGTNYSSGEGGNISGHHLRFSLSNTKSVKVHIETFAVVSLRHESR